MTSLTPDQFPTLHRAVRAHWAPVLLSPIMGSPEKLVIGVVAIGDDSYHVERANALGRLECLYGEMAETAVFAGQLALDELEHDCALRGLEALNDPRASFSGVSVGKVSEGEAASLRDIAHSWMVSLSSLYDPERMVAQQTAGSVVAEEVYASRNTERLPVLVFDYVSSHRPGFAEFFREDIREQRQRRRSKVHSVIIDYSGSRLVANFGTLMASHRANSVDQIKRRLWDLNVNRDTERSSIATRRHEMIIHHPAPDNPQVSERQLGAIEEAIYDLREQAKKEEIGFVPLTEVRLIGDHVLELEAA